MELTANVPAEAREQVENRLRYNLMAWLTTVRRDGQPVSVPVWFLVREDGTILLYSEPGKAKLRHIVANPKVSFTLDVTDVGRSVVRVEGDARAAEDEAPADQQPAYLAKYLERMEALFGSSEKFAERYTVPVVITPRKLIAG